MTERLLRRLGHHYVLCLMVATRVFGTVGGLLVIYYVELTLRLPQPIRTHFRVSSAVVVFVGCSMTILLALLETRRLRQALGRLDRGETLEPDVAAGAAREAILFVGRHHFHESWLVPLCTAVPVLTYLRVVDGASLAILGNIALAVFMGISMALMSTFFAVDYGMQPVIRRLITCGPAIDYNALPVRQLSFRFRVCSTLIIMTTALMIATMAWQRASEMVASPDRQTESLADFQAHTVYITCAAVVTGIAYSTLLASSVTTRTKRLVRAMEQVAAGNLTDHVQPTGNDEIDVLGRKFNEMIDQLRQKDEELRQSQKLEAVGQLAGGMAHEFNNLLQAIFGYTEFAMDMLEPGHPAREHLVEIECLGRRAASITRQLLGFGRREVLRRTAFDPNTAVTDLLKMLRPLIGADVEVRAELAGNVASIHADPGLLQQVLLNLCINARDAMPDGGRLTIRTQSVVCKGEKCECGSELPAGGYFQLTVSDTGCGMTPEVKARIFEPFFTTKDVGKGTGLGLAFVYGVVKQHGGAVHVDSEPGCGTTFRICLPCGAPTAEIIETRQEKSAPCGSGTILVADDEEAVRYVAARLLERAGYTVITAEDGDEALDRFAAHPERIDLALLDVVMPGARSDEVYRRIRELDPDVPVVFCSGYDPDTRRIQFVLDEGLPLLQKPFVPRALLETVRQQLVPCAAGKCPAHAEDLMYASLNSRSVE